MLKEKVTAILNRELEQKNALFLIDLTITPDNRITVVLDGDEGVTLQDCMDVSRAIEHSLDREETDFSLEVASAGATSPLKNIRQYKKNVGRTLEVKTTDENYKGTLSRVDEDTLSLEWKAREPKPIGKGKVTVRKRQDIALSDIVEAKVVLKF